jgi:type I restriction enzyme, S subunit
VSEVTNIADLLTNNLDIWTSAIERRSTAGRGRSKKFGLYGIEKLRLLILEFAVIGKLTNRYSDDEPASVWLSRIGYSTRNNLAICPLGWSLAPLTAFGEFFGGMTPSKGKKHYWGRGVPWVSPKDMGSNNVHSTEDEITELAVAESNLRMVPPGSLLMVARSGILRRKFPVAINDVACTTNQDIKALVLKCDVNPRYLQIMLAGHERRILKDLVKRGMTVESLIFEDFTKALWLTPPLAEQHRIVAKVDELMGLCDRLEAGAYDAIAAHQLLVKELLSTLTASKNAEDFAQSWKRIETHFDTLFTAEDSIDQLKQTILQLAVMGKLVPQDAYDEPASELLKLLSQERAQINKGGKVKTDTKLKSIPLVDQPFEVPASWSWVKLGELTKLVTSGSRDWAKHYADEGAIFVRMGNLSKGHYQLRLDQIQYVNPPIDGEGSRTRLEAGDILISITGDVGMLGLIPEGFGEAYINQHTAMIRPLPQMRGLFLAELFRSPMAQAQFNEPQRGIKNSFRLTDITEFMVPLPPFAEQHRIVKRIDELLTLCDVLKSQLSKAQHQQIHFADAVASRAAA